MGNSLSNALITLGIYKLRNTISTGLQEKSGLGLRLSPFPLQKPVFLQLYYHPGTKRRYPTVLFCVPKLLNTAKKHAQWFTNSKPVSLYDIIYLRFVKSKYQPNAVIFDQSGSYALNITLG